MNTQSETTEMSLAERKRAARNALGISEEEIE